MEDRCPLGTARIYPRSELSPTGFTNRTPKGVQISPHGGREVGMVLAYLVCSDTLRCSFGKLVQADHAVYNIPDVKFAILISNTQTEIALLIYDSSRLLCDQCLYHRQSACYVLMTACKATLAGGSPTRLQLDVGRCQCGAPGGVVRHPILLEVVGFMSPGAHPGRYPTSGTTFLVSTSSLGTRIHWKPTSSASPTPGRCDQSGLRDILNGDPFRSVLKHSIAMVFSLPQVS